MFSDTCVDDDMHNRLWHYFSMQPQYWILDQSLQESVICRQVVFFQNVVYNCRYVVSSVGRCAKWTARTVWWTVKPASIHVACTSRYDRLRKSSVYMSMQSKTVPSLMGCLGPKPILSLLTLHSTSQLSMKVIIQLQYSLTDSRIFHDVKNITQSSLHPTQPTKN